MSPIPMIRANREAALGIFHKRKPPTEHDDEMIRMNRWNPLAVFQAAAINAWNDPAAVARHLTRHEAIYMLAMTPVGVWLIWLGMAVRSGGLS